MGCPHSCKSCSNLRELGSTPSEQTDHKTSLRNTTAAVENRHRRIQSYRKFHASRRYTEIVGPRKGLPYLFLRGPCCGSRCYVATSCRYVRFQSSAFLISPRKHLMGPYNAVASGVIRAILDREYHDFEKLSFSEIWNIASLACTLSF